MVARAGKPVKQKLVCRLYRRERPAMHSPATKDQVEGQQHDQPACDQSILVDRSVIDCVNSGKVIRTLILVDDYIRLVSGPGSTCWGGLQARCVLDPVELQRGVPEAIVLDQWNVL